MFLLKPEFRTVSVGAKVLDNVLADEAAIKFLWPVKGAGSRHPCLKCKNVVSKKNADVTMTDNYFVTITEHDTSKFDAATDAEIYTMVDTLAEQVNVLNKQEFEMLESASGIIYEPLGLLASPALRPHIRPAACTTFDAMHVFFQGGVASNELHLFLSRLKSQMRVSFSHLKEWCQIWKSPQKRPRIIRVFDEAREKVTKDSFKGSASECLAALPLILRFVEVVLGQLPGKEVVSLETQSFTSLVNVVRILQRLKRYGSRLDLRQTTDSLRICRLFSFRALISDAATCVIAKLKL